MLVNSIAFFRRSLGLSQLELAKRLGVCQTTVSAWECGRNVPSIFAIRALLHLFNCTLDDLFFDQLTLEEEHTDA